MNIKIYAALGLAAIAALMTGCTVSYKLSGASIPQGARTVSIAYFPNNAPMVAPILSATLTDALQDRFSRQTRLELINEGGDLAFEGEITNYMTTPSSISGESAVRNRLTVTVRVRFTNALEPALNYNRSFSAFEEYDTSNDLTAVEGQLIPEIVEKLVEDIFNAAVANW